MTSPTEYENPRAGPRRAGGGHRGCLGKDTGGEAHCQLTPKTGSKETHFCDADFRDFVLRGLCVRGALNSVGDVMAVLRGDPRAMEWVQKVVLSSKRVEAAVPLTYNVCSTLSVTSWLF